jgi:hypothetical protein
LFGGGFAGGRFGHGELRGAARGIEAASAQYLGITETALRADLKAGQSLSAIATATTGKSVAGLQAAIIAAETTRLNTEVSSGKITAAQETQRLADLNSRIGAVLTRTWTAGSNGGQARGSWRS